jgi:hypothetical protein
VAEIDDEIKAIKAVLSALEPLGAQARTSVLEYTLKRLSIQIQSSPSLQSNTAAPGIQSSNLTRQEPQHIEQLKEAKKPRSGNEMAALVAYYLAEVAPSADRKAEVTVDDMRRYFKIAKFPLPRQLRMLLANAKNSGYFDQAGDGAYRLNPVGYNLVVHAMPRGSASTPKKKSRKKKKR